MLEGLSTEERAPSALRGLEALAKRDAGIVTQLASRNGRFLVDILTLTESPDDQLATRAEVLNAMIETILAADRTRLTNVRVGLIQESLQGTGSSSVSYGCPSLYYVLCW